MNYVRQSFFSLLLLLLTVPAVSAMETGASEVIIAASTETPVAPTSTVPADTAGKLANWRKTLNEKAVAAKDTVQGYCEAGYHLANDHKKETIALAAVAGAAAATTLYFTNDKFKNFVNSVASSVKDGVVAVKNKCVSGFDTYIKPHPYTTAVVLVATGAATYGTYKFGPQAITYAKSKFAK